MGVAGPGRFLSTIFLLIALAFCLAATGTPNWTTRNGNALFNGPLAKIGPWVSCLSESLADLATDPVTLHCRQVTEQYMNDNFGCKDPEDNDVKDGCNRIKTVQAFSIISCIVVGVALLAAAFAAGSSRNTCGVLAVVLSLVVVVTTTIAWGVWVGGFYNKNHDNVKIDFSVGLMVLATAFSLFASIAGLACRS